MKYTYIIDTGEVTSFGRDPYSNEVGGEVDDALLIKGDKPKWYKVVDDVFTVRTESEYTVIITKDIRNRINERTDMIIKYGFRYPDIEGQRIGLSIEDQMNFQGVWLKRYVISYPYIVKVWSNILSQETMTFNSSEEIDVWFQAGSQHIENTVMSGVVMKNELTSATLSQLEEWVDPRPIPDIEE
jgi:hypothetical protein